MAHENLSQRLGIKEERQDIVGKGSSSVCDWIFGTGIGQGGTESQPMEVM